MAYRALVRAGIRAAIRRLNQGNPDLLLAMAADDIGFAFPGHNTWATMFRPQLKGRHFYPTHRGAAEVTEFARRFVAHGIQVEIEDIVVCGPPWNTRVALRAHNHIRAAAPQRAEHHIRAAAPDEADDSNPDSTPQEAENHIRAAAPNEADDYNNRYVDFLEIRWGKVRRFEVYEDTERTAEWDRSQMQGVEP